MSKIMELVDRHRDTKHGYGVAKIRADIKDEIEQLEGALAACRDAFAIPERGTELENLWTAAMGEPLAVPDYVRASVDALKTEIEKLKFDSSVTVLHRDEITKHCNALKAKVLELERDNASHLNNLRTASNTILGYRSGLVTDLMASAVAGAMDMYIDAARSKT